MKKILALAAAAALAAGASAYAANPFSDVSTSDWAYQAVSDLSDQGIVEGYPDGTFKGETNITRYELAQIVARLMAKEDQYSAEQRATIDKLAGEYADELDSLGVRVSNLEKKVGNISWFGDARLRYKDTASTKGGDNYTGRIRINAKAQVNDSTYVRGRLTTGNVNLKEGADADVSMDLLYVHHDFGDNVGVTLGRYGVTLGQQVGWLFDNYLDGVGADVKLADGVSLGLNYGRFGLPGHDTDYLDAEVFLAQVKADLGVAKLGVDYYQTTKDSRTVKYEEADATGVVTEKEKTLTADKAKVWGANLLIPVGDFRVFGDYYQNTEAKGDPQIWTAGIGYGALNLKKAGSFALDVAYFDVESGVHFNGTGAQAPGLDTMLKTDGSFWLATGDLGLAKNTYLHAEYAFASDADSGKDLNDAWTLSLNYKF